MDVLSLFQQKQKAMQTLSELAKALKLKSSQISIIDEIMEEKLDEEDIDAVLMESFKYNQIEPIKTFLKQKPC